MEPKKLLNYKVSSDYTLFKKLLDEGHSLVMLWVHNTTKNLFSDIAEKYYPKDGNPPFYCLGNWLYSPETAKISFEEKCKLINFKFIVPDSNE